MEVPQLRATWTDAMSLPNRLSGAAVSLTIPLQPPAKIAHMTSGAENRQNGADVQQILDVLGTNIVLLKCTGKTPVTKGWSLLTISDMTPEYLRSFQRLNIGVALGAQSAGLCAIDIDDENELQPFLDRNPILRDTFRVQGRVGREKIFIRVLGNYPAKTVLMRNRQRLGEWISNGGQAVIHGRHPDTGMPYRWITNHPPVSLAFSDINFGPLDSFLKQPNNINRSGNTEYTANTASHCDNCITLQPLHNIRRRAVLIGEMTALDQRLPIIFDHFVDRVYLPIRGHRHTTMVKAVEFLHRAFGEDRIRTLMAYWHRLNARSFTTTFEDHMKEVEQALTGSLRKYEAELPAAEAELYELLPETERDAYRIARDLAYRGKPVGQFFLSCGELGRRIGKESTPAQRILQRFEYSYGLIATVKKGTRRAIGQAGVATEFKWLLTIDNSVAGVERD